MFPFSSSPEECPQGRVFDGRLTTMTGRIMETFSSGAEQRVPLEAAETYGVNALLMTARKSG